MAEKLLIKILITSKEFEHYNSRLPQNDMELWEYAEKTAEFIRQAINAEDSKMTSGVWLEPLKGK